MAPAPPAPQEANGPSLGLARSSLPSAMPVGATCSRPQASCPKLSSPGLSGCPLKGSHSVTLLVMPDLSHPQGHHKPTLATT